MRKRIILFLSLITLSAACADAKGYQDYVNRLAVGIGYPYLSVKYIFTPKVSGELRLASGDGINVTLFRGYYNFYEKDSVTGFYGGDLGQAAFNTQGMAGAGQIISGFVGGEYSINKNLRLVSDLDLSYLNLGSGANSASGIEIVLNIGINYYISETPLK
jgi:hypothetical protein